VLMVVVLIRSNHIGGVKVSVHAASVVDSGVYTNIYTTVVVTSNTNTINTHYLQHSRRVH
jgi:hypothetical protein